MKIAADCVVALDVDLTDLWDNPIQKTGEPLLYLHGRGNLLSALETALEGREPGAMVQLDLEPEDAFGDYDESLLRVEARARFPAELEVGMQFEGIPGGPPDETVYTVTDIAGDKVVLDGNHPLAGIALRFRLKVVEVRPATPDELESGDAFGASGLLVRAMP